MKLFLALSRATLAALILVMAGAGDSHAAQPDAEIASFIAAKRRQTETTARELEARLPEEVGRMFDLAAGADWRSTSNLFEVIISKYKPEEQKAGKNRLTPEVWYPVQEVGGFCELLVVWDMKFIRLFADETFKVIPAGSIYFGGTDPGRFIITAFSDSHAEGKPFFTITQNQLVATNYLEYVRRMYGVRLKLPDSDVPRKATADYFADAQRRWKHDQDLPNERKQLEPGENIRVVNGRLQAEGPTAVMGINALIVRAVVEANPDRQFFVEESFPLTWMYPRLSPVGPIMKLHPRDLDTLDQDTLFEDRRYWSRLTERLVGFKVTDQTSIEQVCAFAASGSTQGDTAFLRDTAARNAFAKLRSAVAGVYAWRATHAGDAAERKRMVQEAEFAFKQCYALYPPTPEAVWRYTMFLVELDRAADAQRFVKSAAKLAPRDATFTGLVKYVQQVIDWKKAGGKATP